MLNPLRIFLLFLTFPLLVLLWGSCSSSKIPSVQQGTEFKYKPGYPEFRLNAFGFIDQDAGPSLNITAKVVKGSLVYSQKDDSLTATMSVDIQITDLNNPNNIIENKHILKSVSSVDKNIANSRETAEINHSLQVSPSRYRISITVEDQNSEKNITQTTETYIPKTQKGNYTLSSIQMFGKQKESSEWNQITGYDVQGKVDSLRFLIQVISPQTNNPMTLDSRLLRIESDTGLPRSVSRNNYNTSSIEYKGINFDEITEVQSNRRILREYSSVFIEYKFANQNRGNYRFEITAQKENQDNIYKARAFGVKSKNFPHLSSARELARPLFYLMGSDKYESLLNISDPDSIKNEIDRFWLKHVGNKQRAKEVIQLYYTRVEEANKKFSNFKEGWKTDRGMIYILFGQPYYVRDRLAEVIWYYSYNLQDPEYKFRFEQPKLNNEFYPFDHYILDRQYYYHSRLHLQRDLWLSGRILHRRI